MSITLEDIKIYNEVMGSDIKITQKDLNTFNDVMGQEPKKNIFQEVIDIFADQFSGGMDNVKIGELNTKEMLFGLSPQEKIKLRNLESKEREPLYSTEFKLKDILNPKRAVGATAGQLPILGKTIGSGLVGAGGGAALGAGVGSVVPGAGTAAGATTGAIIGARTAASYSMFELEAGLMRSELKQEQDELGNALPDDLIKGASIVTGLINAGLEYFGFASVAKTFGAGKVTGEIIRGKIKDLVKDEGVRPLLIKIGKDYGKGVITEGTTEAMQEIVNIVSSDIAKSMSGQAFEKTPFINKVKQVFNAWYDATLATGVISGVGSTGRTIQIMKKQGISNNEANTKAANMSPVEKKVFLEENTDTLQEIVKEDLSKLSQESNTAEMQLPDTDSETLRAFEPIQELLEGKEKLSQADFEKIKPDITDVSAEAAKSLTKDAARKADIETFVSDLKDAKEALSRSIKDGKIETKELNKLEKLANKRSPDSINFENVTFDILSQATGLPVAQIKSAITRGKTDKIDTLLEKVEDQIEEIFPEWTEFYGNIDLSELNAGHNLAQKAWSTALSEYPLQKNKFKTQADIRFMQEIEEIKELSAHKALDRKSVEESLNNYINSINKAIPRIQQQIIKQAPKDIVRLTDKAIDRITSAFKKGIQEGRKLTKEQINLYQKILTDYINNQPIDSTEKAQFLNKVKNVQTETNLTKTIESIESSIKRVNEIKENRILRKQINKLIKEKVIIKDGALRKAKFDFETTQIFKEIKALSKLTQEQAKNKILELQLEGIEPKTFEEKLINKLLTYKAMGAKSDIALLKSLKEDLEKLKKEGIEAKNENELEKKLNKNENYELFVETLKKQADPKAKGKSFLPSKETIIARMKNFYLGTSGGNIFSMINMFAGLNVAKKFDLGLAQNSMEHAVRTVEKRVYTKINEIYGLKNSYATLDHMSEMNNNKYEISSLDDSGLYTTPKRISKFHLIDIYNAVQNAEIAEDFYKVYGKSQIDNLVANLSAQDIALADYMAEIVRSYEQVLNNYSIKKFGLPLAKRANYWPATSEYMSDDYNALQSYIPKTQIPSALKIKVSHTTPIVKNSWDKMEKHIRQAEFINHMADIHEAISDIVKNESFKNEVNKRYGEGIYNQFVSELESVSLTGLSIKQTQLSKLFNSFLGKWAMTSVFSPTVVAKQWIASVIYAIHMNKAQWFKYHLIGLSRPAETIKYMFEEIPQLATRFEIGPNELISDAVKASKDAFGQSTIAKPFNFINLFTTNIISLPVRSGDTAAIIFGGYPYYRSLIESGMSKAEAQKQFMALTVKTQQAGESANISAMQKDPRFAFFAKFLNTPNQYVRQVADAIVQHNRGEIPGTLLRDIIVMHTIAQIILFTGIEYIWKKIFGDDDKKEEAELEFIQDALAMSIIFPVSGVPLIHEGADFTVRKLIGARTFESYSPQLLKDLYSAQQGLAASLENNNTAGIIYNTGVLIEPLTGIPVRQTSKQIDLFTDKAIKKAVSNKKKKAKYL